MLPSDSLGMSGVLASFPWNFKTKFQDELFNMSRAGWIKGLYHNKDDRSLRNLSRLEFRDKNGGVLLVVLVVLSVSKLLVVGLFLNGNARDLQR